MKADLGKTISAAVHYSAMPKRMLPFFILTLPYVAAFLLLIDNIVSLISILATGNIGVIFNLIGFLIGIVVMFVVVFLIDLYIKTLAVENSKQYWNSKTGQTHEAAMHRLLSREKASVKGSYLSALGATIIVGLIAGAVSFIPFIGVLLAIIISLYFFAYLPSVVMKKSINGLSDSIRIFSQNKFETFAFWIVLTILHTVFFALALIPAFVAVFAVAGSAILAALTGSGISGALLAVKSNILIIAIGFIISAFLLAFATLFDISFRTFYYLQMQPKEIKHEPTPAAPEAKTKKKSTRKKK